MDIGPNGTVSVNLGDGDFTDMGDSCWLNSTTRPANTCPDDYENEENGLCYKAEPSGTRCIGTVCTRTCPSGWWDHLSMCERKSKKYAYLASVKWSWGRMKYRSCRSGYDRSSAWCVPDVSCIDKTTGDGNYCHKTVQTREFTQM